MKKTFVMFVDQEGSGMIPLSKTGLRSLMEFYGPGTKLSVTITRFSEKRSGSQNSLLHKYFTIMANHTGYTKDEIKEMMKFKFGPREEILDRNGEPVFDEGTGEIMEKMKSTADYTKSEMTRFIDDIRMFSDEVLRCYLPTPEDMIHVNP